jgi:serine/threonine-protein kinase RsbW
LTTPGYHPGFQQVPANAASSADHLGDRMADFAAGTRIELRIPASAAHIATVRTVAADLAGRQDFDLDGIHDFRMAVDEACAQLVVHASAGSTLRCMFALSPEQIEVIAAVKLDAPVILATNTFGWRVLSTLTELVEPIHLSDGEVPELAIRLRVRRDRIAGA